MGKNKDTEKFMNEINKKIWNKAIVICSKCRKEREKFYQETKSGLKSSKSLENLYGEGHCALYPGCFTKKFRLKKNNMVLLITESHGGGNKKDPFLPFDKMKNKVDRKEIVEKTYNHYINDDVKKFHQSEIRKILIFLEKKKIPWILTDLIKCYVSKGCRYNKRGKSIKPDNFSLAAEICGSNFLVKQIEYFKPKRIIAFGKHAKGFLEERKLSNKIIYAPLPSAINADRWVKWANRNLEIEIKSFKTLK
jgi:hypothetical protein